MNEPIVDVKSVPPASRRALAALHRMQQDGLSAWDRLARYEYAVAGDCLEWSLAQCRITLGSSNPTEFFVQQAELGIKLSKQLHSRVQELTTFGPQGHGAVTAAQQDRPMPVPAEPPPVAPVAVVPAALPVVEVVVPAARPTAAAVNKAAAAIPTLPPMVEIAASLQRGLMAADNSLIAAEPRKRVAAAALKTPVSIPKVFPASEQPAAPLSKAAGRASDEGMSVAKGRTPAAGRSTSSSRKRKS